VKRADPVVRRPHSTAPAATVTLSSEANDKRLERAFIAIVAPRYKSTTSTFQTNRASSNGKCNKLHKKLIKKLNSEA
jgi:hypothetical protein